MSNQNVTLFAQEGAPLSSKFGAMVAAGVGNDLGEGIRGSYGIVSIKSGRFRIKYKGQETMIMDGPNPVASIDVVIVRANAFLNKQYYAGKYQEGNNSPPDCWSLNGKTPSAEVKVKQAPTCELCPKNQWGSLIGDNGQKQKACRDTKKLAVVPLADIRNIAMGGAMLFRVPPSSLKDLSTMADGLKARGYPYNSVAVRIGFDMTASHPKPTFQALRPLTDDEADHVLEMFNSDSVSAVLADNDVVAPTEDSVGPASAQFIQPVVPVMGAPVAPVAPAAPVAAPAPAPAPAPVVEARTVFAPPPVVAGPPVIVQAFDPNNPAPPITGAAFASPTPNGAPQAPPAPKSAAPVVPVAPPVSAPVMASDEPTPVNALESDIGSILAGLSQFTAATPGK